METDIPTGLLARLAVRGLAIKVFDDQTLTLRYAPEKDAEVQRGHIVDIDALSPYAREALLDLLDGGALFPRLQRVLVEIAASE